MVELVQQQISAGGQVSLSGWFELKRKSLTCKHCKVTGKFIWDSKDALKIRCSPNGGCSTRFSLQKLFARYHKPECDLPSENGINDLDSDSSSDEMDIDCPDRPQSKQSLAELAARLNTLESFIYKQSSELKAQAAIIADLQEEIAKKDVLIEKLKNKAPITELQVSDLLAVSSNTIDATENNMQKLFTSLLERISRIEQHLSSNNDLNHQIVNVHAPSPAVRKRIFQEIAPSALTPEHIENIKNGLHPNTVSSNFSLNGVMISPIAANTPLKAIYFRGLKRGPFANIKKVFDHLKIDRRGVRHIGFIGRSVLELIVPEHYADKVIGILATVNIIHEPSFDPAAEFTPQNLSDGINNVIPRERHQQRINGYLKTISANNTALRSFFETMLETAKESTSDASSSASRKRKLEEQAKTINNSNSPQKSADAVALGQLNSGTTSSHSANDE